MARRPPRRRRAAGGVLALAAVAVGACGSGGSDGGCGPVTREALDPGYLVHVVEDAADLEYASEPPTSGPHQPAPAAGGVEDEPLSRPVQVGVLERGDVLVQHDPDLPGADRRAIEALAGDGVVVAPNADLPTPVVATAWLYKQACDALDVDALEAFVEDRRGRGPDQ